MIAFTPTDKDGEPVDQGGNKLSVSAYNPNEDIKKLFARCQMDYGMSYRLQHRPFDEFDGMSLLQRARVDQQTFGAYVGAEYIPEHKKWRWRGRKNTARNKLIGILAHMLAGMLYPFVYAYNESDEEDKMTARVMRILVENHLKKAGYDMNFLFAVTSALVNPAVFVEVEYVEAMQKIKEKMKDGSYKVTEAVDELLSGIGLHIVPIDQILLADFFTFDLQRQPNIVRVRRIPYDEARKIYAGKYFDESGKDQFDYVEAGKTRWLLTGQEHQTLYDIEWTEADRNYVQEATFYYRPEDLEVTFVGGVYMGEMNDVYNSNRFKHRRMSLLKGEWKSAPIYPFAKTGFEPLDPSGRFAYYKSAAFKEYWDDAAQNKMHQLLYDGTYLDVFKPLFMSGVSKVDGTVIVPGATVGMPQGAVVTPYQLGSNLSAAMNVLTKEEVDMSESTQDKIMSGQVEKGITAYATMKAEQNARVFLGVFGVMIADLVKQVGELVIDCIIQHTTVGEVDATIPEALRMKYKTIIARGKESGKDVTNKIIMTDRDMGREMSSEEKNQREWELFFKNGGLETDQYVFEVNPYKFARHKFSLYIDPDRITMRSTGTDQMRKDRAFALLTDPRVAPYTDQEAVVQDFVIDEYSDGDPDRYKRKENEQDLLGSVLNLGQGAGEVGQAQKLPITQQQNVAVTK